MIIYTIRYSATGHETLMGAQDLNALTAKGVKFTIIDEYDADEAEREEALNEKLFLEDFARKHA